MAKGRKLTASRIEYLLGSYDNGHAENGASELREDDVWSTVDEVTADDGDEDNVSKENYRRARTESIDIRVGHGRNTPWGDHHCGNVGGLSLAFEELQTSPRRRIVHQFRGVGNDGRTTDSPRGGQYRMATSAPVKVPDWGNIYRVSSVESIHGPDETWMEDREFEMVPPHEYIAREYARSRKSAADSVIEGVGRTLKGRDMRRVRDAVWSQTGFDG